MSIRIEISSQPSPEIVHRFRNCSEDIYRAVSERSDLNLDQIDSTTTSLVIGSIKKKDAGFVMKMASQSIRDHGFADAATITKI